MKSEEISMLFRLYAMTIGSKADSTLISSCASASNRPPRTQPQAGHPRRGGADPEIPGPAERKLGHDFRNQLIEWPLSWSASCITVVCHQPVSFVSKPHPSLEHGRVGLENVDQNESKGYKYEFCLSKKKNCQRPLSSPNKARYLLFNPKYPLLIQI